MISGGKHWKFIKWGMRRLSGGILPQINVFIDKSIFSMLVPHSNDGLGASLADASAAALSTRLWAKLGEAVVGDRGEALGEEEALLGLAAVGVDGPFFGSGGGAIRGIAPNEVRRSEARTARSGSC